MCAKKEAISNDDMQALSQAEGKVETCADIYLTAGTL